VAAIYLLKLARGFQLGKTAILTLILPTEKSDHDILACVHVKNTDKGGRK
jgi:hypothetical protein